jgi:hypothetical protein
MRANTPFRYCIYAAALIIIIGLGGCAQNYGSFKRDEQVAQAFKNNQLPSQYKYYYNAHHNLTYAILGIDPKYKLPSKFWREIEPNTEEFKEAWSRVWEDYNRHTYGANLIDPDGNTIGVWYSAVNTARLRFHDDDGVEVLLHTPFLWGPDGDDIGGGFRPN